MASAPVERTLSSIPFSVLDLAPVLEGYGVPDTFRNSVALAKATEQQGYLRYWLAEHHNMESIASSATTVLIGHIAGSTHTIRVGSGGIMLPNHAPLVVAEQFGTLGSLYPHRIDMGLGRAPGTDQLTARALRRESYGGPYDFQSNIMEVMNYMDADNRDSMVRAIPGEGVEVPIWILGSSTDSAYLAASMGLPYAFASHFAPTYLHTALDIYRRNFRPSRQLQQPYTMACINVIAADTQADADRLATSYYRLALGIFTNTRRPLQPPIDSMDGIWSREQEAAVRQMMHYAFIGDAPAVQEKLQGFVKDTQVDELMMVSHVYDQAARIRSYEIAMEIRG